MPNLRFVTDFSNPGGTDSQFARLSDSCNNAWQLMLFDKLKQVTVDIIVRMDLQLGLSRSRPRETQGKRENDETTIQIIV